MLTHLVRRHHLLIKQFAPSRSMATAVSTTDRFDYIILGGGNAAGYAVHEFVENLGVEPGKVCEEDFLSKSHFHFV